MHPDHKTHRHLLFSSQPLPVSLVGTMALSPGQSISQYLQHYLTSRYIEISWHSLYCGPPVLIEDYRYCGLSFPRNINPKDSKERKTTIIAARDVLISKDWAEDIRASLKFIRDRFRGRGLSYLGTSAGGTYTYTCPFLCLSQMESALRIIRGRLRR